MKLFANADTISITIIHIESNLGAFITKQAQIDALASFSATQQVQMSTTGYGPYQPSGAKLHALLRNVFKQADRIVPQYRDMNNQEVVDQLFKIGRNVFEDDFLDRLRLPTMATTDAFEGSNLQDRRDTATQEHVSEIAGPFALQSKGSTSRAGKKRKHDAATHETTINDARGADASSDHERPSKRRARRNSATATETARPCHQDNAAEAATQGVPTEEAGRDNEPDEGDTGTDDPADIMALQLELTLQHLDNAITETASIMFPGSTADRLAQLDTSPSPELQNLYQLLLANEESSWKHVAVDLQSKGILTAQIFFQSLIWTFVQRSILDSSSFLSDVHGLLDARKPPGRYLDQVLRSQHRLNLGDLREYVFKAQLNDERFRRDFMSSKAGSLTYDLMLILAGHVQQLDKTQLPRNWHKDVVSRFTTICQDALLLRRRLMYEPEGWRTFSFRNGSHVHGPKVEIDARFPGRIVAFTTMPSLRSWSDDRRKWRYLLAARAAMGGEEV